MSGIVSQLDADFAQFASIVPQSQSAGGSQGGTALQQLEQAMQAANIEIGGGSVATASAEGELTPQWSWGGFFKKAGKVINTAGGIGKSLGLFEDTQDYEVQFLEIFLKGQVQDLIQKLHGYVKQYSQLTECIPAVTETVRLFGQGSYVKALAKGYEAYNCIRAKL